MEYFTADPHFYHANIIKYSGRPFENRDHMNNQLTENWNKKVTSPNDIVHVIGDFTFGDWMHALKLILALNGQIHFVMGSHDGALYTLQEVLKSRVLIPEETRAKLYAKQPKFHGLIHILPKTEERPEITLCHYAMRRWPKSHYGTWHLYGHSHGRLPDDRDSLSFDVGVDCHNYSPLSLTEVAAIMAKKTFKPIGKNRTREDYDNAG